MIIVIPWSGGSGGRLLTCRVLGSPPVLGPGSPTSGGLAGVVTGAFCCLLVVFVTLLLYSLLRLNVALPP